MGQNARETYVTYDVKIMGGLVVDGTGGPARQANVAVSQGRIVEVGDCKDAARKTLDAHGAIVTPGFVDIHTHYDGQVSWDDQLAPSIFHGVTTAVMGNCGVGFAPARPHHRARLIELMEGVEDIPGTALSEGLRWDWESFPQYMGAIDSRPHAMDFAVQVVHDPLRVFVMGERALAEQAATSDDIEAMRVLTREALLAGAVGFSTGRTDNHRAADGSHTPAAEAHAQELCGIARAFEGLGHGVIQAVSDFDMLISQDRFDPEFDLLEQMALATGGRPLSISLLQRLLAADQWEQVLSRAEKARARGMDVRLQVAARGIGVLLGLEATFHPFMGFPSYKAIAHLPLDQRVARMRDPAFRATLLTETSDRVAGDGSAIPPLADHLLGNLEFVANSLWRLGDDVCYEPKREDSLYAEATRKGLPPLQVMYDAMLERDGKELLYFPIYNYMDGNLDVVHQMLTHPQALAGLSDGGAHVGTVCDASFPSYMLLHWARDRARGKIPLERVVHMLTQANAAHMGFLDRGVIAVGKKADLNVIDHAHLKLTRPVMVRDLPAGGKRLMQHAQGYRATLVGGELVVEHDVLLPARPGRLVRGGARV